MDDFGRQLGCLIWGLIGLSMGLTAVILTLAGLIIAGVL